MRLEVTGVHRMQNESSSMSSGITKKAGMKCAAVDLSSAEAGEQSEVKCSEAFEVTISAQAGYCRRCRPRASIIVETDGSAPFRYSAPRPHVSGCIESGLFAGTGLRDSLSSGIGRLRKDMWEPGVNFRIVEPSVVQLASDFMFRFPTQTCPKWGPRLDWSIGVTTRGPPLLKFSIFC